MGLDDKSELFRHEAERISVQITELVVDRHAVRASESVGVIEYHFL